MSATPQVEASPSSQSSAGNGLSRFTHRGNRPQHPATDLTLHSSATEHDVSSSPTSGEGGFARISRGFSGTLGSISETSGTSGSPDSNPARTCGTAPLSQDIREHAIAAPRRAFESNEYQVGLLNKRAASTRRESLRVPRRATIRIPLSDPSSN